MSGSIKEAKRVGRASRRQKWWYDTWQGYFMWASLIISFAAGAWLAMTRDLNVYYIKEPLFLGGLAVWAVLGVSAVPKAICLALGMTKPQWHKWNPFILGCLWLATPALAAAVPPLRAVNLSFVGYWIGWLWYGAYLGQRRAREGVTEFKVGEFRGDKLAELEKTFSRIAFRPLLPSYLPKGYTTFSLVPLVRGADKRYNSIQIIYRNNRSEHLIWIKEAIGDIPEREPLARSRVSSKDVNGITVAIERQVGKRGRNEEPAFVPVDWSYKGTNFNLRSDGLPMSEIEKIIASMIQ